MEMYRDISQSDERDFNPFESMDYGPLFEGPYRGVNRWSREPRLIFQVIPVHWFGGWILFWSIIIFSIFTF